MKKCCFFLSLALAAGLFVSCGKLPQEITPEKPDPPGQEQQADPKTPEQGTEPGQEDPREQQETPPQKPAGDQDRKDKDSTLKPVAPEDKPDPDEEDDPDELTEEEWADDYETLLKTADAILQSARLTQENGSNMLTWTQPAIPDRFHLCVDLSVYSKGDEQNGSCCLEYYNSDGAWLADPADYDPTAGRKSYTLETKQLSGRRIQISVKLYRSDFAGGMASLACTKDFDGTVSGPYPRIFSDK